jgi:hypothetical protein
VAPATFRVVSEGSVVAPVTRGLHSFTFQLNASASCGTGGVQEAFRGYSWRGWRGCLGV